MEVNVISRKWMHRFKRINALDAFSRLHPEDFWHHFNVKQKAPLMLEQNAFLVKSFNFNLMKKIKSKYRKSQFS